MCIILFSYKQSARYQLVLAANRDEFYARPTRPLFCWDKGKGIIAGQDIEAGGTWLGVNKSGRFAALTNFREVQGQDKNFHSRGEIALEFLDSGGSKKKFTRMLVDTKDNYRGYNLIYGDNDGLHYYSNRIEVPVKDGILGPGLYGLSNHLLNTEWPKVARGKKLLKTALAGGAVKAGALFKLLQDDYQPADYLLPTTGVNREWERKLAPIFISSEGYGTRSSAVVFIGLNGSVEFLERTYSYSDGGLRTESEKRYMADGR